MFGVGKWKVGKRQVSVIYETVTGNRNVTMFLSGSD